MMKKITHIFAILVVGILFLSNSTGRESDAANSTIDGGTCANCHSGSGAGSVLLTNVPTDYQEGQTYSLTLTVNDNDAMRVAAGFQIVATDGTSGAQVGTFTPASGMRLTGTNRLVQSAPKNFASGTAAWTFDWTAPTGTLPNDITFHYAAVATDGDGGPSPTDYVYTGSSSTVLPVDWLSFSAKRMLGFKGEEKMIALDWTTASERDNSHFVVEKSTESGQNFKEIGKIKAVGNSAQPQYYQFWDKNATSALSYYRIKQIDNNGKFSYSKTHSVAAIAEENSFVIFPNQLSSNGVLNLKMSSEKGDWLDMFDLAGRLVFQKYLEQPVAQIQLSEAHLSSGFYLVRMRTTQQKAWLSVF